MKIIATQETCDCKREELRVNCGTRGVPDTVAAFRAWRGSRDLVAQSPKFNASAVAISCDCEFSLAQRCWGRLCPACGKFIFRILILLRVQRRVAARRMDSPSSL